MISFSEYFKWSFPGGWPGLALFAALILILIVVSYKYTLRDVALPGKLILIFIRLAFTGLLLFCLCGPVSVKEKIEVIKRKPSVAVIIDESGSMRKKGYNGRSRLDEAGTFFRRLTEKSKDCCEIKLFSFAGDFRRISSLDEIEKAGGKTGETALFKNISAWAENLKTENAKAVVWISDGIETAAGSKDEALAALAASTVPHIFVPAALKLPAPPVLSIMSLECPGEARPAAVFAARAIIKKSGQMPGKILFSVKDNGKEVYREEVEAAGAGQGHYPVKCTLSVNDEGIHQFEAEIKSKNMYAQKAFWTVSVSKSVEQKILLFQGRLTLDQAYLRRVFIEDTRAQQDVRFAKDVLGRDNPGNAKIGAGFPDYEELCKYNVVILNAVKKSQISRQMEEDLKKYLDNGGALLFMVLNNQAADEFSGSSLEKMLPVIFESGSKDRLDAETSGFLKKMREYRKGVVRRNIRGDVISPPLNKFEITSDGRQSRMFTVTDAKTGGSRDIVPMFQDFAIVKSAKPGAILLAETSAFKKDGKGHPVLAVQNYGRGRSAVMCSDGLWRWKLSMPSGDNSYDIFWQNLLLWLSAGNAVHPVWALDSCIFPSDKPAALSFKIPAGSPVAPEDLKFAAERKGGQGKQFFEMKSASGRLLTGEFKGEPGAAYALKAMKGNEVIAEAMINFQSPAGGGEMENLYPDLKTLAELSRASGYELVPDENGIDWNKLLPAVETKKISSAQNSLWHKTWIFLILLAAFIAELILRRILKLV